MFEGFAGQFFFLTLFALFVGLAFPSFILPWSKKPTRLKVFLLWGFIFVIGLITHNTEQNHAKFRAEMAAEAEIARAKLAAETELADCNAKLADCRLIAQNLQTSLQDKITNEEPNSIQFEKIHSEMSDCQTELTNCRISVHELNMRITPDIRLAKGKQYLANNDFAEAKKELIPLIELFGDSDEAKIAHSLIDDIEKQEKEKIETEAKREKEKIEAEAKRVRLAFKALKQNTSVTSDEVTIKFNSVSTGEKWIFDDYGSGNREKLLERGDIFVTAKVSVSSKSKNPKLPPIFVYKFSNGHLSYLGTMGYMFSKWKNFNTYSGNNPDTKNDFSYSETVSFSCGISIDKEEIEQNAIFVVVKRSGCFERRRNSSPPLVSYKPNKNCNPEHTLTLDDFDKDYALIKMFNSNKL